MKQNENSGRSTNFQNDIQGWVCPNCVIANYNSILDTNQCSKHISWAQRLKQPSIKMTWTERRVWDRPAGKESVSSKVDARRNNTKVRIKHQSKIYYEENCNIQQQTDETSSFRIFPRQPWKWNIRRTRKSIKWSIRNAWRNYPTPNIYQFPV